MKKIYLTIVLLAMWLVCGCGPSLENTTLELATGSAEDAVEYTFDRQTGSIKINCNRSWKAASSAEWLVVETPSGKAADRQDLLIRLYENGSYDYRQAEVTITAGKATLVVKVEQAPRIYYFVKENFNDKYMVVENTVPTGWYGDNDSNLDADGDGFGWRCCRDSETDETFAYSYSYHEDFGRVLTPDNWLVSPRFTIPATGFTLRWEVKGGNADYLGDKYQVCAATYDEEGVHPIDVLLEEVTTSAETLTAHRVSLDGYIDQKICIAFRHFDSEGLSRVMITNVEVSNRK